MDIIGIKRKFDLLKMANASDFCLISELAKELKVSKTDLMQFVLDNPKLFHAEDKYSYKKKSYTTIVSGMRYKDTKMVKDKALGLGIVSVYLNPEDNFRTEEWLQKQIVEKAKYIHISEFDNYGYIEGYFIQIDEESNSNYREHVWRNTIAKVKEIQSLGITSKETFYYGGFGDYSKCPVDYAINSNGLEVLKGAGWTFNKLNPLSRRV